MKSSFVEPSKRETKIIVRSVIVTSVSNHYGKILLFTLDLIVTVSKMLLHDLRSVMQII